MLRHQPRTLAETPSARHAGTRGGHLPATVPRDRARGPAGHTAAGTRRAIG